MNLCECGCGQEIPPGRRFVRFHQPKKQWEDYPAPVVDTESGCLRWQGPHDKSGYGRMGGRGYAHRVAWERENGSIPEGLTIDHVAARGCRWKDCVLTQHLEPVTLMENVMRARPGENNRLKTHCPKKHPYSPENTRYWRGQRLCRQCKRDNSKKKAA